MNEETKQPTGEETPETQAGAEQEAPQTEAPETEKKEEKAAKVAQVDTAGGEINDFTHCSSIDSDDGKNGQKDANDSLTGDQTGGIENAGLNTVVLGLFGAVAAFF